MGWSRMASWFAAVAGGAFALVALTMFHTAAVDLLFKEEKGNARVRTSLWRMARPSRFEPPIIFLLAAATVVIGLV